MIPPIVSPSSPSSRPGPSPATSSRTRYWFWRWFRAIFRITAVVTVLLSVTLTALWLWIYLASPAPSALADLLRSAAARLPAGATLAFDGPRMSTGWPPWRFGLAFTDVRLTGAGWAVRCPRLDFRPSLASLAAGYPVVEEVRFSGLVVTMPTPPEPGDALSPTAAMATDSGITGLLAFLAALPGEDRLPRRVIATDVFLAAPVSAGKGAASSASPAADTVPGLSLARVRLDLERRDSGWEMTVKASTGGESDNAPPGRVRVRMGMAGPEAPLDLALRLEDVRPAFLDPLFPGSWPFRGGDFPVSGDAAATVFRDGRAELRSLDLTAGPGQVARPDLWEHPLKLARLAVSAHTEASETPPVRLVVDCFSLDTGGTEMSGSGVFRLVDGLPDLHVDVNLTNLEMGRLDRVWPLDLVPEARGWLVHHFRAGRVSRVSAVLRLTPDDLRAPVLPRDVLLATAVFSGVELAYLPSLAPIREASGTATFSAHDIDIRVEGAAHYRTRLKTGHVFISGLAIHEPRIEIRAEAAGMVDDLRQVTDALTGNKTIPLLFADAPAHTRLWFAFPLWYFRIPDFHHDILVRASEARMPDFYGYDVAIGALSGRLRDGRVTFTAETATVASPKLRASPATLTRLTFDGDILYDQAGIAAADFRCRLGDSTLKTSGRLLVTRAGPVIATDTHVDRISAATVLGLWPDGAAQGARDWLRDRLAGANLTNARFRVAIDEEDWARPHLPVTALEVSIPFTDGELACYPPLPPLKKAAGRLRILSDHLVVELADARIAESRVTGARAVLEFQDDPPRLKVHGRFAGPLDDLLAAHNRLRADATASPARISASAASELDLVCPIRSAPGPGDVRLKLTSVLSDVRVPGAGVEGGRLNLVTDGRELTVRGGVTLARIPLDITWVTSLESPGDLRFSARVPVDRLAGGRFPASGMASVSGTLRPSGDKADLVLQADLTNVDLNLGIVGLVKPAGIPATLDATGEVGSSVGARFSRFTLRGPDLLLNASADIGPGPDSPMDIRITEVRAGNADFHAVLSGTPGAPRLSLGGARLDLGAFFKAGSRTPEKTDGKKKAADPDPGLDLPISLDVGEILLANDQVLTGARGALTLRSGRLIAANLSGNIGGIDANETGENGKGGQVQLSVVPEKEGGTSCRLHLRCADGGALLAGLDMSHSFQGGEMEFTARCPSGVHLDQPLDGRLSITDFTVLDAPALAQLLALVSLVAIPEQLRSGGIGFEQLDVQLGWLDRRLTITSGRMEGLSWVLTADGERRPDGTIFLEGLVVPFNILNRLLQTIPVLGRLVTGDGIIAANYRMEGPASQPEITVEPLSALSVGFLRDIVRQLWLPDTGKDKPVTGEESTGESTGESTRETAVPFGPAHEER